MKINTNNPTVTLPRRSDVTYQDRGSEWQYRWFSGLILSSCLMFASNAQAFKFPSIKIPHPDNVSSCGGSGQRPCNAWEAIPSCDSGLAQNFVKGTCGEDVVGKFVEKSVNTVGTTILNTGETVGKFTAAQGKKAVDEAKKGVESAKKAMEGVAAEAYKGAAELFLGQVKKPLEDMAKAWRDSRNRKPLGFSALKSAIQKGDGAAINAALKLILEDMFVNNNSPFHLIAQDLKDKNAGSFLVVVGAGGGVGITVSGDIGIAIDIDYLIHVGKTGKSGGFSGPIASLFTVAGLQIGPAAGGGVDVVFGYHVADPNGVNGPSMDLSLEVKLAVGGSVGAGMDMTKAPWKFNTAGIGLGAGAELKFAAGPSAGFIMGQLCGNGKFVPLVRDCPVTPSGTTGTSGSGTGTVSGSFKTTVKNVRSNRCMDVAGVNTGNGANVQLWDCVNVPNQKTTFIPVAGKTDVYSIKFDHSGKCLDVSGAGTGNGSNVQQWACVNVPQQQFKLKAVGGGIYNLIAQHSGKLVDVEYANTHNGASIFQWESNGWNSQQWRVAGISTQTPSTGSNSNGSQTLASACKPQGQAGGWTNIKKVQFKNAQGSVLLLNEQDNYNAAYEDFTGTGSVIRANPGDVLKTLITSSHGAEAQKPTKIWVDRNNDGAFNETDELLFNAAIGNVEGSMTIPANMTSGSYRLRIRKGWNHNNACHYDKWTQVEDYVLQIGGSL